MSKTYFELTDDAMIKYTPISERYCYQEIEKNCYKTEIVMTKEIFQECYKKWIEPQRK